MKPKSFRHELKHAINFSDYLALRPRLLAVAKPDPHVGAGGRYHIRSLYFDNLDDKALREKINGVNNREKFRIRYYNGDTSYIKLEKKSKLNGLCVKTSARVTQEQCSRLLTGDTGWLRQSNEPLLNELYAKMQYQQLRPKTVVDYLREPYVYHPGNVRITIDSQICTGLSSQDFLNPQLPTVAAGDPDVIILEVKYDAFLPDIIADIVQTGNRHSTAFSKYAFCRIYG